VKNITIKEILKGCEVGRIQSVGYMQVIPLLSDLVDDTIAPPKFQTSTRDYGTLVVDNPNGSDSILPFAAGFITQQKAQNHATTKAAYIPGKRQTTITNAACIQSSQGGSIQKGDHPMTILPWSIREAAMIVKDAKNYSKLWPTIEEFNQNLGLQKQGHLEYYLSSFKKQLDVFVAEFETLPNQVGAIIIMNGKVVGIEKAPNYSYWKELWTPLIRECYGSLAIQYRKQFGDNPAPPKTRVPLKSVKVTSLKDIANALDHAKKQEESNVKQIVRKFIKNQFKRDLEQSVGSDISVESLTHKQFAGQIVRNGAQVLYASLMTTGKWLMNYEFNEADDFKI